MTPPHAVQFYNDDVFLIDTVSAFITAGLKENGAIIVIATAQHREELRNTLQAVNNSSITYIDAVELLSAFMVDGWPNETRFISTVGPLLQRAALKGPVRILVKWRRYCGQKERRGRPFVWRNWGMSWHPNTPSPFCVRIRCRAFRIRKTTSHFFRSAELIHMCIPLSRIPFRYLIYLS
jgi:MEDS: MEthanogen/methylotroph, DcmR Sensory domain